VDGAMHKYKLISAKQIVDSEQINEDNSIKIGYITTFTGSDPFYARQYMLTKPLNFGLQKIIYGGYDIANKN
jgi:hypothetical protein